MCLCVYMFVCGRMCVCVCICMYIYIYHESLIMSICWFDDIVGCQISDMECFDIAIEVFLSFFVMYFCFWFIELNLLLTH